MFSEINVNGILRNPDQESNLGRPYEHHTTRTPGSSIFPFNKISLTKHIQIK